MKHTKIIAAVIMTLMLTACTADTNTAEETTTIAETTTTAETTTMAETATEAATTTATEEETEAETETETEAESVTEAATESIAGEIVPPDADTLQKLFALRMSDDTLPNGKDFGGNASPSGTADAFYVDIDGDDTKEFCFIWHTLHGSVMYVCDYTGQAWEVVDVLDTAAQYTYLQTDEQGKQYLFAVIGIRTVEGLRSYTYKDGVEEDFELFDVSIIGGPYDDLYHEMIQSFLKEYDNLQPLYDLPHASTASFYDISFMYSEYADEDIGAAQEALEQFTNDVAALFD